MIIIKVRKIWLFSLALLFLAACGDSNNDKNPVSSGEGSGISDLQVEVNSREAIITWKTPVASATEFEYGLASTYGSSIINPELALDHQVELNGLSPGSLYCFRIEEREFTFTTPSEGLGIRIAPALRQVKKGEEFETKLRVEEVSSLFGVAARIYFDGAILEAVRVEPAEFLGSDILPVDRYDSNSVRLGMTRKKGSIGATGSGVIARAVFLARSEGRTEIEIDREKLKLKKSDGSLVNGFSNIMLGQAQIIVE